jgi:hypothetical protein
MLWGVIKKIAERIIEKKGNYVLAVKKNQPELNKDIEDCFEWLEHAKEARGEKYGQWESSWEKECS